MPAGDDETVPLPDLATVSVLRRVKAAVTLLPAVITTVQALPEALSQPDQPEKMELAPGVAVRVTEVPWS
jgi:hypothetical protein